MKLMVETSMSLYRADSVRFDGDTAKIYISTRDARGITTTDHHLVPLSSIVKIVPYDVTAQYIFETANFTLRKVG